MDKESLNIIRAAEEVKSMTKSNGWREFAKPLLDDMIRAVVGGQNGDRWVSGQFSDSNPLGMNLECLAAYKQALIEFNEQVYNIIDR